MLLLILKLLKLLAPVLFLAITPIANAGLFGLGSTNWQEEVLLHDGTKIVVDRSVTLGGPHEIGQRGSYTKVTLAFVHPVSGEKVTWEDEATPDLRASNFLPMSLDIYQDGVYLVASPMGCLAYNKWGRPNPPYVIFKFAGKTWNRVVLGELPSETKTLNLIFSSPDTEVERLGKRFVDAETIRRLTNEYRQPQYRTILREEIEERENRCIKTDFYPNAGWLGPDWFSDQPSLNACLNFCVQKRIGTEFCPCEKLFKEPDAR